MKLTTRAAAARAMAHFPGRKVLVIGDFIVDHFVWGGVERISPEAPVPVVEVREESYRLGGALNVAANLASLGAKPTAIGILGQDDFADEIRSLCERQRISLRAVTSTERPTIRKTRIIAGSQQLVRIDREIRGKPEPDVLRELTRQVLSAVGETDAVVFSDYGKGAINRNLVKETVARALKLRRPVVADPKPQNFWSYRNVTLLTPNTKEVGEAVGRKLKTESDIESAGKAVRRRLNLRALLITRGEQGMSLFEASGRITHVPTRAQEVFDVTGAGDTATAVCAISLAAGLDLRTGLELANLASGIVVGKIGTAVASPREILDAI